jgi:hypothetical protein
MNDNGARHIGLSRRQLERELEWMMRHVPAQPAELAKLIGQVIVALIDKNNAALGKCLDAQDEGKPGAP